MYNNEEKRLKKMQQNQLNNLLKRVQRDRDEQLLHRQHDSQVLIQRNRNMLNDTNKRHQLELTKTEQFLRYALGHRASVPGKNILIENSHNRSVYGGRNSNLSISRTNQDQNSRKLPFLASDKYSNDYYPTNEDNSLNRDSESNIKNRHKSVINSSYKSVDVYNQPVMGLNKTGNTKFPRQSSLDSGASRSINKEYPSASKQSQISKLPHLMGKKQNRGAQGRGTKNSNRRSLNKMSPQ
jgi:hypothetical protein